MSDITETRWKRYGKDRIYVKTDGIQIGHIDLIAGTVNAASAEHEELLRACARKWLSTTATSDSSTPASTENVVEPLPPPPPVVSGPPRSTTSSSERESRWTDLSTNSPGAAARAKRQEVNSQAPVINFIGRVLGVQTDERSWRVGAKGEKKVASVLEHLPSTWHVLHSVPVGDRGADIDHVVVGPAGVFTLNTKRHPGGKAWVGEHAVLVNGHKTDYLRNARHEARRAAKLLSTAIGCAVVVRSMIVFVDLDSFEVKQQPRDVIVTTRMRLVNLLSGLPTTLASGDVDAIHAVACRSTTWLPASAGLR